MELGIGACVHGAGNAASRIAEGFYLGVVHGNCGAGCESEEGGEEIVSVHFARLARRNEAQGCADN
jgi:hypothetical protein